MVDWVQPQMPQMGADAWVAEYNLRKSFKSAVIKRVWIQPQMPQMGADAWVPDRNLRKSVKSAVPLGFGWVFGLGVGGEYFGGVLR
jgi:hypothetical protein